MSSNFFNNFYGVLFTPDKTFDELKTQQPVAQGVAIVVAVSILSYMLSFIMPEGLQSIVWLGFSIIFLAFSGIISWLFFAAFFELVAGIFEKGGNIKIFLTLSAFALIPWLFIAPIELLKTGGSAGNLVAILLELGVWLWTIVLMVVAVIKSYELSLGKALIFLTVPFIGGCISFNWFIGFFATLGNILKP